MCLCLCVCVCVCVCVICVILFCTIVFEGLHSDELPTEIACTDSSKRGIVSLHGYTSMINSNVPTPPSPHTHKHTHKHTVEEVLEDASAVGEHAHAHTHT